jgi:hypothetical protein
MEISFLKRIKFAQFVLYWLVGTIVVFLFGIIMIKLFSLLFIFVCIFALLFGGINTYLCYKAYKKHLTEYMRIDEIFDNTVKNNIPVKKSILYHMQHYHCTNIMARDLAKKYNIKL